MILPKSCDINFIPFQYSYVSVISCVHKSISLDFIECILKYFCNNLSFWYNEDLDTGFVVLFEPSDLAYTLYVWFIYINDNYFFIPAYTTL